MHPFRLPALLLLVSCATATLVAQPQAERHDPGRKARVTFYEHANFRGGSITIQVGDDLADLTREYFDSGEGANDRISSIRMDEGVEVLVFRDAGFRGGVLRVTHSIRNLEEIGRGWNDAISSVRFERSRGDRRPGPDRPDFGRVDKIIQRAYREILQRDPDEGGLRVYRGRMTDDRWSEQQLHEALRHGDEFRAVVDRIVTRVYRELLGREPDPAGRRSFGEHMVRDGWSEEDVRNAIRRSDEFRRRHHPPGGG